MFNIITTLLKNNGYAEVAKSLNDMKKIRRLDWAYYRYLAIGNEDGKWFTIVITRHSLQDFRTAVVESSRLYFESYKAAAEYYNSVN